MRLDDTFKYCLFSQKSIHEDSIIRIWKNGKGN
jgi:hypothetical protein